MVLLSVPILYIHLACATVTVENSPSTMIINTARFLDISSIFRSRHSTGEGLLSKETLCKVKLAVSTVDSSDTLKPGRSFKPSVSDPILEYPVVPVTFNLQNRSPAELLQVNVAFPLTGTTYVSGRAVGWASVVRMTESKGKDTHCFFIACKCKTITLTFTICYSNIWSVCHYCHHWEGIETEQETHFTCRYTMTVYYEVADNVYIRRVRCTSYLYVRVSDNRAMVSEGVSKYFNDRRTPLPVL